MAERRLDEQVHRLVKLAMDDGSASSLEAAEACFARYRLRVEIRRGEASQRVQQATLLSAVAVARRVFLGGVQIQGTLDVPLLVMPELGETLAQAVIRLGGVLEGDGGDVPTIVIGGGPVERREGFCVRTGVAGWRAAVVPGHAEADLAPGAEVPMAAMLAAGLAVNEAFMFVNASSRIAGRRMVVWSLWEPSRKDNLLNAGSDEPILQYLPSKLWLIGLGHLGQAYLWGLGLLPYGAEKSLSLVLQDTDEITGSTESTSILSDRSMVGAKKTRAMATWAEARGFRTSIVERLFDGDFRRQRDDPQVALCGVDNTAARRALDQAGFNLVIEAGLGRGHRDFQSIRIHALPGPSTATALWPDEAAEILSNVQPAYANLLERGDVDQCGMTLLAGKAVGAPFVGMVAAAQVLGEILRQLHSGPVNAIVDVDLRAPDERTAVPSARSFADLGAF